LEDAEGIARVHVDAWNTSYRGIIPDDVIDARTYESRCSLWKNVLTKFDSISPLIYLVAEETKNHAIIGFIASNYPNDQQHLSYGFLDSFIQAIYVLKEYQHIGVGKQLLTNMIQSLKNRNYKGTYLWVLEDNPNAIQFYEKMGGKRLENLEKLETFGNKQLKEVGYSWTFSP